MKKKIYKKTFEMLFIIFIIALATKIFQHTMLPKKYFYDSGHILYLMNGHYVHDNIYNKTAMLFDKINFLGFDSIIEWSILFGIIFNIAVFVILLRRRSKYTIAQYIFIYASIVLLNIYVFNLSKDIIQFSIFLIVYFIITSEKLTNLKKVLAISIVLLVEALVYRMYYGIMAIMMVSLYFIYNMLIKNKKVSKKQIIKLIIFGLAIWFLEVYIVSIISTKNYTQIINARSSVNVLRESKTDAHTIINDLIGDNTNILKFMGNYSINFVRMAFPIELFFKGIKYVPFIIYQIFIIYYWRKQVKVVNDKNILSIIVYLSFFMISVIFEPDFGSFIRHESALFLCILELTGFYYHDKEGIYINEKN